MKDISIKLRHIYVRYLLIAIGFIICYSTFRWYFDYKLGVLHLKEDLLDFWIPFGLPFIPIAIWLRRGIRFLDIKGKYDNGFFFYQFIAAMSIFIPTMITQDYIKATRSKLIQVDSPYEIAEARNNDCYEINDFNVIKEYAGVHRASRITGRYNQDLNFTNYFVVPLVDKNQQIDFDNHRHWYGFKFTKRVSNHANYDKKNKRWESFFNQCIQKYEQYDYSNFEYLQGLSYSDDRDGYIAAVRSRQKNNTQENLIILEPMDESFTNKSGDKFVWIFGSFGIGAFVFLLMILIPSIDITEFRRYENKKPLKDDDLKEVLRFVIPSGDDFISAILVDINLIVFILLVFSGINIISATPTELLELGANRRYEVMNGEYWRLFTSMFLHGGILHVTMNLFGIAITCSLIEPVLGRLRTLFAYLISGIGSSLASIYWHENTISVGASGAIFGMMGVMIALLLTKKDKGAGGTYYIILVIYGGVSLLFGFLGGIDNAAHIGGLLVGIVIGFLLILTKWKGLRRANTRI